MTRSAPDTALEGHSRIRGLLTHIAGTPVRSEILSVVAESTIDLRDLAERTNSPRTTLRHNLQKMRDEGLVEETLGNEYRLTPLGRAVLSGVEAFESQVAAALRLEALFDCLPPDELDVDITSLSNATVTAATQAEPFDPNRRLADVVAASTRLLGYFPTNPFPEDDVWAGLDGTATFLFPAKVAHALQARHGPSVERGGDREGAVSVVEDGPGYGIVLADERTLVLGLDDNGKPDVLVETTADDAREWARGRLDSLRAEAVSLAEFETPTNAAD